MWVIDVDDYDIHFQKTASGSVPARALDLVPRLPASRARDLIELDVLSTMCREVNSSSFSAAFVGRDAAAVYGRAIEIARSLDDPPRLYAALTQACNYDMVTARYEHAKEVTTELERIERSHELDPRLLHGGIFARGYIAFFRAELGDALALFTRLVPPEHEPSPFHGNLHGRALALGHLACLRWVVGDPDRAIDEATATIALAERIESPILQALGHVVRARLRYLRRDPLSVIEDEAPLALRAASLDLGLHTEASAVALWAQARRGPLSLAAIEPMLERLQQRLNEVSTCSTLVAMVLIDVLRLSDHLVPAGQLADQIIALRDRPSERVYLPELLRMRGELRARTDAAAAARYYNEALELARSTGARSLEQRPPTAWPRPVGQGENRFRLDRGTSAANAAPRNEKARRDRAFHCCSVEREKGFEPSTSTLARWHSTTELLPQRVTVFRANPPWCQGVDVRRRG
jgi:hypothetical protein